ncbi:hypothetical protein ACFQ6N_19485 [Kitasatospora sp. NPDC056446]|uniref:hypothetical protein n=1 Tax=Kitasatospora sp. NPDC056446 TaxID=3345819 RepID=UPI00368D53D2
MTPAPFAVPPALLRAARHPVTRCLLSCLAAAVAAAAGAAARPASLNPARDCPRC